MQSGKTNLCLYFHAGYALIATSPSQNPLPRSLCTSPNSGCKAGGNKAVAARKMLQQSIQTGNNAGSRFRHLNTLGSLTGLDLLMCFVCKNFRFVLDLFEFAVGLTTELASMAAKFFGPAFEFARRLLSFTG